MLLKVLTFLIKSIVSNPDEVVIEEDKFPYASVFRISVNPNDIGSVIGKRGHTINSLRNVMNAISGNLKISLEINS